MDISEEPKGGWQPLLEAARRAQARAYAPYSNYRVGAAILGNDGQIYTGCNVENASYSLCICAERNAIFAAVASGVHTLLAVAVYSDGPSAATPCGACRQVISEFATNCAIVCLSSSGARVQTSVCELLPHAFGPKTLGR